MQVNLGPALSLWEAWRAPLVALAAAALAALSCRPLRLGTLGAAGIGIGAAAGFAALGGWAWAPATMVQRLAPLAAAATLAWLLGLAAAPRAGVAVGGLIAVLGGWFLTGTPMHLLPLLRWIEAAGAAAALALGAFGLGAQGPGRLVLASVSLACGLSAAHAAHVWVLAALIPGAAAVGGQFAPGRMIQPASVAVAAVAAACVLASGDLQRLSFRPIEAAALAPVLALWLAARLKPRLHLAASGIGLAAATLVVWMFAGAR